MPFTSEQIEEYQRTYKKAFNQTLSKEEAVLMMDKLLYYYKKIMAHARLAASDEANQADSPESVVVYAVRKGHLLVYQELSFPVQASAIYVPAGAIKLAEAQGLAAHRIVEEQTGRTGFTDMRFLGTDQTDAGVRHFFQCKAAPGLPNAGWRRFSSVNDEPETPSQCFWIPIDQANNLADNQGAFVNSIRDDAA